MFRFIPLATGLASLGLLFLMAMLLILRPLAIQATPAPATQAALARLSDADWAAIRTLLPESARLAVGQDTYFKASNSGQIDRFGLLVAMSGDTLVVGTPNEASAATEINGNQADNSAPAAGAAYVFVRSGTTWTQRAYLKASNRGAGDQFSETVFINDSTMAVGASLEDSASSDPADGSAADAGAAYVFVRLGTAWSQQALPQSLQRRRQRLVWPQRGA